MVFSSNLFLFVFLPLVLLLYYLNKNHRWRNSVLVIMSVLFYAWGAPSFLMIFFISLLVNYVLVMVMEKKEGSNLRKILLAFTVIFNLAILVYFKYTGFFIHEINRVMSIIGMPSLVWPGILLPIGISFFTFHKISYAVDIYRNRVHGFSNLLDYNLYLLFFPQLIAGPIIRYHEIADQIRSRIHTKELFLEGIWRFAVGLSKKVVIADAIGRIADLVFNSEIGRLDTLSAWIGIICYTFQLYYDFSGYSDMAIGLGRMFGFHLPENFNRPYLSGSITEYWQRWHLSLSRFFKDYVYVPLGGNRASEGRHYFNLWVVFLLCAFWHGANWVFIAWGVYHGLMMTCEKLFLLKVMEKLPSWFRVFITFTLIVLGFVIFRSPDLNYALNYFKTMFSMRIAEGLLVAGEFNIKIIIILAIAAVGSFVNIKQERVESLFNKFGDSPVLRGYAALALLIYSITALARGSFSPFIYFQF